LKNYNLFVSLVVAGTLFLSGCGGGGSDSSSGSNPPSAVVVSEAFFIDSPVAGLFYKSQSKEGTTSANGGFKYSSTDTNVSFKAGEITLGTINIADINADSRLFVQDLVGVSRATVDNADVLKIASLLQSLDTGANANGITLDENDLDNLSESADIEDVNVTRQLSLAGKTLKSEARVKEHLGDTMRRNGIALYNYTPQTSDSNITTLKNIVTNGTFSASDKNDNFLELIVEANATHGSVELIANSNSFKYTPDAEYVGSDSFTFKAYDGEKYSQVATVNIVVEDVVTTSNDTTVPTAPTIVSLDAQKDSLTLFWLNATDETTPAEEIRYEIHLSTDENFTADSTTLQQTLVNTLEADVSGLTPNTLYYIKVKALDSADNSTVSAQSSMQTLAQEVVFVQSAVVKQAASLHLEDAQETNSSLVFEDSEKSGVPNAGDILVGNAQDAYLKRVVSVDKNGTTTTLEVVDAAITDVVKSAKLSSKVVLFGTGNTDTSPNSAMRRSVSYKTNNTKEKELTWRSGRFGVIQSTQQAHSKAKRSLSKSNTNFKATVVQDILTVVAGERLNIEVTAQMTQAGIDDDWTFTTMSLEFKHNGKSVKSPSWTDSTNTSSANAIFSWTPSFKDISDTEYIATYEICAKDTTPSLLGNKRDCETLKSKIKVIAKPNDEPSGKTNVKTKVSTHSEFTNDIVIDFTPTLTIETEVVDGDVASAEISVKGRLDFNVTSKFLYTAAITKEYDIKNIIPKKKYYKMYLLGGIPVYQEITFTLDAKLDAKAHGEINATSVLDTSFEMAVGMTYDGNKWTDIDSTPKVKKEYRASFGVAGGVEVNVRLIPNIEVTFYKVATAGFSVEPWLKGTLAASGSATVYTDFQESDAMAIYGLNDLNITAGLEGKVYASLKVWKITLAKYPESGKKSIFNPKLSIFNIPAIKLDDNKNGICSGLPYQLNATIINPDSLISNDFVNSTIEWKVFPEIGASITPTSVDKLGATFEFSKKGEFTVYMIGNSEKLGKYGQQYATFNINTNDCPIIIPDTTPPVFTAGSAATADVNENQTSAITLSATDETSSVTYSISETDSPSFDVNGTTGVVTFKIAPDYEATPTKTSYLFVATAEDSTGNKVTQNVTINILDVEEALPDTTPPVITLNGVNPLTQTLGSTYTDAGATAIDDVDGSVNLSFEGSVDTNSVGTYYLLYTTQDSVGNEANATRTVHIVDAVDGTIIHKGLVYEEVTSASTGRVWLDRNLGASQVCTALDDTACYGDYYQWGRNTDGHEKSLSETTDIQATDVNNAGASFITSSSTYDYDWAKTADSDGSLRSENWSKTDGSSVCPVGFRVPTIQELKDETTEASTPVTNNTSAYSNFLKLPSAGYCGNADGSLFNQGSVGIVWSSSVTTAYSRFLDFHSGDANTGKDTRANGFTVRCIKEAVQNTPPTSQDQNLSFTQDSENDSITLSASDADGDALTYTVSNPTHGTLSGTAPNLSYTPTAGYSGSDSFTFKVNDGTADSEVATVNISVTASSTTDTAPIKKTGQTKSYDKDGNEVTDGSLKDDAYYQKGATPRYTRASDMVTDELTTLMWQDDEAAKTVRKQWLSDANYETCKNDTSSSACKDTSGDTATTYCSELTLGGYTDWRLPSSVELEGIVDYGKVSPAIDTTYFNNVSSNYYWSSTTYEGNKNYAWIVYFGSGYVNSSNKGNSNYVRCVRDGQ